MKLEKYFYIVFGSAVMVTCVNTFAELPFIASAAIFLVLIGAGVPCFYFSEKHERVEKLEQIDKFYVPLQNICVKLTECITQSKSAFEKWNKCEEYLDKLCALSEQTAKSSHGASDALHSGFNEINKVIDDDCKKLLSQLSELSKQSLESMQKFIAFEKTAENLCNQAKSTGATLKDNTKKIKEIDEKIDNSIESFPNVVSDSMINSFNELEKIFRDKFSETLENQENLFSKYDTLTNNVQEGLNNVVKDSTRILQLVKNCYKEMDLIRKEGD